MIKEIVVIGLCAVLSFLVINHFTQAVDLSPITSTITDKISAFTGQFTEDPMTAGLTVLTGSAAVIPIAKLAYDALKKEASETITNQSNVIVDKTTELQAKDNILAQKDQTIQQLQEQLKMENPDLTALQTAINEKNTQITKLQGGQESIQKMHDSFVKSLMSNAGNQTIVDPVTQKTYWVIEKPAVTIVK